MKVMILMSVYNGVKYLVEQLTSIYNQNFEGTISYFIRDDGSTDNTLKVIDEFKKKYNCDIKVIKGINIGPQKSFLELIMKAEKADYYFFSDQDDIWNVNKISKAVKVMQLSNAKNVCYCSNFSITDSFLNISIIKRLKQEPEFTPLKIIFYNKIPGCTIGFSFSLLECMKKVKIDNIRMHDSFALTIASITGKIIYDDTPMILHRIHDQNVIGFGNKKIIPHQWIKTKIKLLKNGDNYDLSELAQCLINTFGDIMSPITKSKLILLAKFKNSIFDTIRLLSCPDTKEPLSRNMLSIRFKILFRVF